ncbi:MAG: hypothetical protein ACRETL_13045, partial [Gammaproteobacteria bacterium]
DRPVDVAPVTASAPPAIQEPFPLADLQPAAAEVDTVSPRRDASIEAVVATTAPIAQLVIRRSGAASTRIAFPFTITSADQRRGKLVVGDLPRGVAFTKGKRNDRGLWTMTLAEAKAAELKIGAKAPSTFKLTFMLVDPADTVVSDIEMTVTIADAVSAKSGRARSADSRKLVCQGCGNRAANRPAEQG